MEYVDPAILANGVRTDHPVPGLAFADDSVLPLENRYAIEALGRDREDGLWGRTDARGEYWKAFSTDPTHPDLAWLVLAHPEHGRTILLVRDDAVADLYSRLHDEHTEVTTRHGGYWWDGTTWYQPKAGYDWITMTHHRHKVANARTVTAVDWLDTHPSTTGHVSGPRPLSGIDEVQGLDAAAWTLALHEVWLPARPGDGLPVERCVVTLDAPELTADALLGAPAAAARAGIAPSTLRAYRARGEGDVPAPQALAAGQQPMWSAPVIARWIDDRAHSHESLAAMLSIAQGDDAPPRPRGIERLWERTTAAVSNALRGGNRPREAAARSAAWFGVANPDVLKAIVPVDTMLSVLAKTIQGDITRDVTATGPGSGLVMLDTSTARLLDWLVQHYPYETARTIQQAAGDALREHKTLTRAQVVWAFTSGMANAMREVDPAVMSFVETALEDRQRS